VDADDASYHGHAAAPRALSCGHPIYRRERRPAVYASKSSVHRDRYVYHTLTSGYNPIKVPVHFKNRNCLKDDIGCKAVYDEDMVGVRTVSSAGHYKVELYESCLH
jgi:hypothetical protein